MSPLNQPSLPETAPREWFLNAMPESSVCAEIGVHLGDYAARILEVVKPRKLHLIDPWALQTATGLQMSKYGVERGIDQASMDERYERTLNRFTSEIGSGQVVVHRAASASAATMFPDRYFDWIYIDGNHLYESVLQDLTFFYPKIRPKGYITGDDYGIEGWWNNGVTRAVDEFIAGGHVSVLGIKNAQFALRKSRGGLLTPLVRLFNPDYVGAGPIQQRRDEAGAP